MIHIKNRNIVKQTIDAKDIKVPQLKTAVLQTDLIAANDTSVTSDADHTINPEGLQLLKSLWASSELNHQIGILGSSPLVCIKLD